MVAVGGGAVVAVAAGVVGRAVAVEVGARVVVATGLRATFAVGVGVTGPVWRVSSAGKKIAADATPMSSASNRSNHAPVLLLSRRLVRGTGLTTVVDAGVDTGIGGVASGAGSGTGVVTSAWRDKSAIGATAEAGIMGAGDSLVSACQNS